MQDDDAGLLSRERLAGYDRAAMDRAVNVLAGAGAGASNQVLNYALTGVHEVRLIDFDHVELSNVTRSPCFRRELAGSLTRKRWKARELADRFLELSYAPAPVARHAVARVEALGLGAFAGASVVVSAVDSFAVRAYLADATRLLGIPFVESGFTGSDGHITVFPNDEPAAACWRCLNPRVAEKGLSCTLYAEEVVAAGRVPATQPLAALWGAMVSEAAIQAAHRRFPLGGKVFHLDLRTGESRLSVISRNPRCPGVHRSFGDGHPLELGPRDTVVALLDRLASIAREPILRLPFPFVADAPCARCGASVPVRLPGYAVSEAPTCKPACGADARQAEGALVVTEVGRSDELAAWSMKKLGIAAGATLEVEDVATGALLAVRLQGGPDELFTTRRRAERNVGANQRMDTGETAERAASKE